MRTFPGSRRGTARPRAEPSPSPTRRAARSPPVHGPRQLLPSMRWLALARREAPPSKGDPACGIGRTLRRPLAPSPGRVGSFQVPPWVRARVRAEEAEGEVPDGAPGSAGRVELLTGARLPLVDRDPPTPR